MHEGDIGIAKALIAHIIRILDPHDPALLDELNARYVGLRLIVQLKPDVE